MNKSKNSQTGAVGEKIASIFLKRKGFRIIEFNFRKPWGEIDIVAEKGGFVHFVEVKAVSREVINGSREIDYRPEEMVTRSKLVKVARTATLYMESKKDSREFQIDVVGVIMDSQKRLAKCRYFPQVLEDNL
ncbi:MAG: YraN family protein [Minisyncoccia bacterium]